MGFILISFKFQTLTPREAVAQHFRCMPMRGFRGVRTPPPPENHKTLGFLNNTGLDPLKNHKATKPAFNVGVEPSSARQRNAIHHRHASETPGVSLVGR